MRDESLKEKVAKDARWPNMYRDLDALPQVEKDLDVNSVYVAGRWIWNINWTSRTHNSSRKGRRNRETIYT